MKLARLARPMRKPKRGGSTKLRTWAIAMSANVNCPSRDLRRVGHDGAIVGGEHGNGHRPAPAAKLETQRWLADERRVDALGVGHMPRVERPARLL